MRDLTDREENAYVNGLALEEGLVAKEIILGQYDTPQQAEASAAMATQMSDLLGKGIHAAVRYQVVASVDGNLVGQTRTLTTDKSLIVCQFCKRDDFKSLRGRNRHITDMHKGKRHK